MAWALKGALQGPPGAAGASNAIYTQEWTWSNQTAVPPNNTQLRTDTGDWATATKLYIDDNSNDGADRSGALSLIRAGDELRISQRTDDSRWVKWSVIADSIDRTGYFEVAVAYLDSEAIISNSGAGVILNLLTMGATAVVVADETAVLPRRAVLNFTGAGVTAADDAANDRINVTIPGGGGGGTTLGLRSALPVSPGAAGSTYKLTDGPYIYVSDGSAWQAFVYGHPVTEPILSDFAWVNQGTATTNTAGGGIALTTTNLGSDNNRLLVLTPPAAPYTVTIAFTYFCTDGNFNGGGLVLRDSVGGKLVVFKISWATNRILAVDQWNSATAFSSTVIQGNFFVPVGPLLWLRMVDDATNRLYQYSWDGINFISFKVEGRTVFITANQIGFFIHNVNIAVLSAPILHLYHWKVTTP